MREDLVLLKDLFKTQSKKIDQLVAEDLNGRMKRLNPPQRDQVLSGEQLKRILALIENNSHVMTSQRDSFNNLMVRVQLLEKAQARYASVEPLSKSTHRKFEFPSTLKRAASGSKIVESADASISRNIPKSLEPRKSTLYNKRGASGIPRGGSYSRNIQASPLTTKAQDSDLDLFDIAVPLTSSNVKKSQLRANLYNYNN